VALPNARVSEARVLPAAVAVPRTARAGIARWLMLLLVMLVMFVNYVDRGNLAVTAPVMQREMHLSAAGMGVLFSAFTWTYLLCIPIAGAALDKLGPRVMFAIALIGWSASTMMIGAVSGFAAILACRMCVGLFESPVIPTNMRCVSVWFPERERGQAIGWYTATQSVAVGPMAPLLSWILVLWGWRCVFYVTGGLGVVAAILWYRFYRDPSESSLVSPEELNLIRNGGGLVDSGSAANHRPFSWRDFRQLFRERQLVGMFIGQYAVMTTLYFFLTWFPTYLIKDKGLTILQSGYYAIVPFVLAVLGALGAGRWSDWMIARGASRDLARKAPIIVGFLLASTAIGANYTNDIRLVISLLGLAFFGQAMASAVTGALFTDIAPKGAVGLAGGLLTFFANLGSALSPLIVGLMVERSGGFGLGLVYISVVSAVGAGAYLLVVGKVRRIVLAPQ
jgi:ACS family D-galactonate transporter-like MFS transporter